MKSRLAGLGLRLLAAGALWALLVAGCAACGGSTAGTGQTGADAGSSATVVTGTVAYRERMALPADAVVEVWITDVTPTLLAVPVTAQGTVATHGRQVPIEFSLPVEAGRVEPGHDYGLHAVIKSGNETLFQSEQPVPILTRGHGTHAALWLRRVAP